jgi:DNA-binding transcriptional regulator YhcF (GntR family)
MEFENNIPIYIQVINQIKKDIITGKLPMGAKLPSTRELRFYITSIRIRRGGFIKKWNFRICAIPKEGSEHL